MWLNKLLLSRNDYRLKRKKRQSHPSSLLLLLSCNLCCLEQYFPDSNFSRNRCSCRANVNPAKATCLKVYLKQVTFVLLQAMKPRVLFSMVQRHRGLHHFTRGLQHQVTVEPLLQLILQRHQQVCLQIILFLVTLECL